jgi:hypothetical protein
VPDAKRRSLIGDIPKLGTLKKGGAAGFAGFRDTRLNRNQKDEDEMDSDSDDQEAEILGKMEDINDADVKRDASLLSPEDAERTGQVAEGIRKIKVREPSPLRFRHGLRYQQLKRQHSAEPLASNGSAEPRKSSKSGSGSPSAASTPKLDDSLGTSPPIGTTVDIKKEDEFMVGSPLKKQRSSMADFDDDFKRRLQRGLAASNIDKVLNSSSDSKASPSGLKFGGELNKKRAQTNDDDEEL